MSIIWIYIIIVAIILINIYIIKNEYKYKKIPNKLLIILLALNIFYFVLTYNNIFFIPILIKLFLLIIWMTLLYIFKIWNPSYLKYIFVSSILFLWNWEITFISNIFFIIFIYIILYFIYFYSKILINPKRLKTYINPLKQKTKWDFKNWVIKNKNYLSLKIITIILWFISTFILIRVIRYYLQWELWFLNKIIEIDNIKINFFIIIFVILLIFTWILHRLYHKYLMNNYKYLLIIIFCTISFITYEFIFDYTFISQYLHRILTFLILLFFIVWIIINMWKYLFFNSDSRIINYKKLKTWDIIDMKILASYLIWQKSLENDNIKEFLKSIKNPIDKENCNKLKNIIQKNSTYQKNNWKKIPPNIIRVYNTFTFSPFIFWSLIITFLTWQNILINLWIVIFKKIIWLY